MTDTTVDEWKFWTDAREGRLGPVSEANPQTGYWKHKSGHPVAIWRQDGTLYLMLGEDYIIDKLEQGRIWLESAKKYPPSFEQYEIKMATGMWPGLPDVVPLADETPEAERGPGDNSKDLSEFQRMRAEILGDVAEARAYYAKHPIQTKDDADKAQDWGDRLMKASRDADAKRLAETKPLRDQIEEINGRWNAIIREANRQGIETCDLAQQWGRAEAERQRQIAAEEAKRKAEAEAAERKRQADEARAAAEAAGETPPPTAEVVTLPVTPVVPEVKVMLGTGASGNRRSVKTATPQTATILDLSAAAAHFASVKSPEMIAVIQKLADRAIKARTQVPGIRFSWEDDAKAKETA